MLFQLHVMDKLTLVDKAHVRAAAVRQIKALSHQSDQQAAEKLQTFMKGSVRAI